MLTVSSLMKSQAVAMARKYKHMGAIVNKICKALMSQSQYLET